MLVCIPIYFQTHMYFISRYRFGVLKFSASIYSKKAKINIWAIPKSRCIVVLSVLLDDYKTVYACC